MGLLHLLSSERSKHLLFNADDRDQTSVTIVRWPMCKTISSSSALLRRFLVLVLVPLPSVARTLFNTVLAAVSPLV